MVGQQSRYLARIVGDLTMLARVGHEDVDLDRSTLEFETIVGRVQDSLEIDYVGFSVDAPAHLHLRVDGERIQQVLLNLVSNAIRYGGEDIEVVAIVRGTDVTIEVHDSGNGVPTRYQYTMWERFNRGAHHLNATVPGSGIGLAIVKLLSEAHGGRATYRRVGTPRRCLLRHRAAECRCGCFGPAGSTNKLALDGVRGRRGPSSSGLDRGSGSGEACRLRLLVVCSSRWYDSSL